MRAVCLGGGPGGLYFAISLKLRDPAAEVVVVERNRPDDTFGWGVVLSDETLANLEANDPESAARDPRRSSSIGTTSRCITAARCALRRPRLFRHRPQAAAQHLAGAGPRARRQARIRDRGQGCLRLCRLRPDRRRRRREFARARRACRRVQARHRRARLQIYLARHPPEIRRRFHLHLRRDRARLDLGARLPVRRRHRDLHRRVLGGDLAARRLRPDDNRGDDRRLREDLRPQSRRP